MNLDFYSRPIDLSFAGRHAGLLADLPRDAGALAGVVQGLLMHEHVAPAYGVTPTPDQHAQAHVRPVAQMLDRLIADDPRPLQQARTESARFVCVCRSFTLLHITMLRAHGVPARARCGFGAYFEAGRFVDHWVTEYWNDSERRWVMVDPQLDERQRRLFRIEFDPLDVPRERFLVAGDAWELARTGKADPEAFGILDMGGLWFIAGNLVRDAAALNNREMLPWDVWGAMRQNDADLDLDFFDRLAELTREPDRHFDDLRAVYRDERVRVPPTVFNVVLSRPEAA